MSPEFFRDDLAALKTAPERAVEIRRSTFLPVWRWPETIVSLVRHVQTGGTSGALTACEESAETELPAWLQLIDLANGVPWLGRCAPLSDEGLADLLSNIRATDAPGIAAMAAKNVQPAPEPVLSLGGEQATAAEFAAALQLVRAKNAPPVKESPRGLLCVRPIDHRCGSWGA